MLGNICLGGGKLVGGWYVSSISGGRGGAKFVGEVLVQMMECFLNSK